MSVLTGVFFFEPVALLAEGVDRNVLNCVYLKLHFVALLAEGVDRNIHSLMPPLDGFGSPSSRRAWIEIAAAMTT